jgi:solute carrier family 35 protein E1
VIGTTKKTPAMMTTLTQSMTDPTRRMVTPPPQTSNIRLFSHNVSNIDTDDVPGRKRSSSVSSTTTTSAKEFRHRDSIQVLSGSSSHTGSPLPYYPMSSNVTPPKHQRSKSFSEQSQEVVRQLAPPISIPLVLLCLSWYATSAMSNTLNKTILMAFPYPISLSMVQFFLAVCFGMTTIVVARNCHQVSQMLPRGQVSPAGLRYPTKQILMATAPMGIFQLSGHIFSHMSTTMIPVSLVHTIKALSPLITVAAYRILFGVKYEASTYMSLVPLTVGVIMTCSTELSAHFMGLFYALVAAVIFVSQNMFSKKLLTYSPGEEKLDKLNILCYCSSLAFLFTFPIWLLSEGVGLLRDGATDANPGMISGSSLAMCFFANGMVHFAQNLLAFQVLGMVSPVTYSVASLIKRIVVITVAIVWFGQKVTTTQGWGILLTFGGLYLYDRCGADRSKNYELKGSVLPK